MPVIYVNKKEFYDNIVAYKKACRVAKRHGRRKPPIPAECCQAVMLICQNHSRKSLYSQYPHRDEMVADAIENCIRCFDNFNPSKSKNPFGYFSLVAERAFWRRIRKEKVQLYTKYKIAQRSGVMEEDLAEEIEDGMEVPTVLYDNINDFIKEFERREKERHQRNRAKAKEAKKPPIKRGLEKFC